MDSQRAAMWVTLSEWTALSWVGHWARWKADSSECVRVGQWDAKRAVRMAGYWDVSMVLHSAGLWAERWAEQVQWWAPGWAN